MRAEDQYLKFVLWSDEDQVYVGFCPDLFPWRGVCHAETEEDVYAELCAVVRREVADFRESGKELPPATTRAMRDAVLI